MKNKFNLKGKRKKCAEMIAEMAKSMSFPKEIVMELEHGLDLTKAPDELIDMIYTQLVELLSQCSPATMARIVAEGKTLQN